MSTLTPLRPPAPPQIDDIDWRIATACRLAQTSMPPLIQELDDTPLMAAARAYGEALMTGGDTAKAFAAYDDALNEFVTEFRLKLMYYREKDVVPLE